MSNATVWLPIAAPCSSSFGIGSHFWRTASGILLVAASTVKLYFGALEQPARITAMASKVTFIITSPSPGAAH
ncbi:hypothetical protein D3C86_2179720 [compost metagenome]